MESKDKVIVNIKKDDELKKIDDGVFKDKNGKLLYEPDEEFEMRTCCGQITSCDKPLLQFIAKTTVALSVLGFCFIQLSRSKQSEFASSTISLILGTYLGSTSATLQNKSKKK